MAKDWRLETLESLPFLRGVAFIRKPYRQYRPGWDHDHCAACGMKLAEPELGGEVTLPSSSVSLDVLTMLPS